jgi:4-amino-4-deoxy-L-arabinose transferase-like glycosyltransferase
VLLFGWRLGSHDLWPTDEPRFGLVAREMRDRGDLVVLSLNNHLYTEKPPLFFWAINGFAALRGGVDEWAARLPSVAAGILAMLLILVLGEWLYDRRTGALAAVMFATSVQILERARWASIDMTLNLFVLLAIMLLGRAAGLFGSGQPGPAADRATAWSARLGWVAMGLGTLAKGPVAVALPLLALVPVLLLGRRIGALRRLAPPSGILLFLVITLAWFLPFALRIGPAQAVGILTHQTVDRYVDAWNARQPWWFFGWRFPVGFFPWSLFLPWAVAGVILASDAAERRAGIFLIAWAVGILLFFTLSTGKRGVYIIPLYPAVALLTARLFTRAEPPAGREDEADRAAARRRVRQAALAWAVVALAVAVAALIVGPRRAPEMRPASVAIAVLLVASGAAAAGLARRGHEMATAGAVAAAMCGVLLVGTEAVFPHVNRHLNLRGFAEKMRGRLESGIPLATTEEKRDAWVFYGGRFVQELDTRERLLAYLATGPVRDLLIEEEELRQVRSSLPAGTVEILRDQVSGRPQYMLRLPMSGGTAGGGAP